MGAIDLLRTTIEQAPGFDAAAFNPDLIADTLPPEVVRTIFAQLSREEDLRRFGRFASLFPDEGEFRRDLYPRHMEHFAAGKTFRERCFMAANRCLSPWTYLETPAGPRLSADTWTSESQDVLTWAGGSRHAARSSHGLLKGIEPAFRLVTGSGRFSDCSHRHRVLTNEGWLSLDQLVSRSDGLRCWHRDEDYQASCAADGYLGDRPLRSVGGIDLSPPPSRDGVRAPFHFDALPDEAVHALRHIHACPQFGRLASRDDLRRLAGLFSLFAGASSDRPDLSLSANSRALQRLALASAHAPQSAHEWPLDLLERDRVAWRSDDAAYTLTAMCDRARGQPLSQARWNPGWLGGISLRGAGRTAIFYPSDHPLLAGGERIVAIVPLGFQPIIDAHVPETNCYLAGGIVHHNTGKTVAGGYEVACHLTGIYPHWWPGRRFRRPGRWWVAGDTNETTRDILQTELLGQIGWSKHRKILDGSGIMPREAIGEPTWKTGVQNLVDTIPIRHRSGGTSMLGFKSFDQGRRVFQGTAKEGIWLDEECPVDVYSECLIRTATTRGILILTFTPLNGISEVVKSFLPSGFIPGAQ